MKKVLSLFVLFVLGFTLQACTPAYKIDSRASKNFMVEKPVLKAADTVVIITPKDGGYKKDITPKTGAIVAKHLAQSCTKYAQTEICPETLTVEQAKEYAAKHNYSHVIYPVITNWEDRQPAVSGLRDRVSVRMTVIDVKNNKTVDDSTLYGNGSTNVWATGKTPEILLDKPFDEYTKILFGMTDKK